MKKIYCGNEVVYTVEMKWFYNVREWKRSTVGVKWFYNVGMKKIYCGNEVVLYCGNEEDEKIYCGNEVVL